MGLGWNPKRRTKRGRESRDLRSSPRAKLIILTMDTDGGSTAKKLWRTALFLGISNPDLGPLIHLIIFLIMKQKEKKKRGSN